MFSIRFCGAEKYLEHPILFYKEFTVQEEECETNKKYIKYIYFNLWLSNKVIQYYPKQIAVHSLATGSYLFGIISGYLSAIYPSMRLKYNW